MTQDEPDFLVLEYITITWDTRTGLVIALGGDIRAAGILQTAGGFIDAPGPRGDYHRLPHRLPIEKQRQGATAAAHALFAAGYSVHLDPTLNLFTHDEGRQATHRRLAQLAERAGQATDDREVAAILTEVAAPVEGLLPLLREVLVHTWSSWSNRLHDAGRDTDPADQLMDLTCRLSHEIRQIEYLRNQAAHTPPTGNSAAAGTLPAPPTSAPSRRR
jgi:hypothetical protein